MKNCVLRTDDSLYILRSHDFVELKTSKWSICALRYSNNVIIGIIFIVGSSMKIIVPRKILENYDSHNMITHGMNSTVEQERVKYR